MKAVKKGIQIIFGAIGILMTLLVIYYAIYEPQTIDKFVVVVTFALSMIISCWLNGCIQWFEGNEGDIDDI